MPQLSKKVLSQYVRTQCDRQLRLNLSPDNALYRAERHAAGMPPRQPPRPGLEIIKQAGETWEHEKLVEMDRLFEERWIVGSRTIDANGETVFDGTVLSQVIHGATVGSFLVKPSFEVVAPGATRSTFADAHGLTLLGERYGLQVSSMEPDLVQIRAAGDGDRAVDAAGDVVALAPNDVRKRLRIIDIKLTAEANAGYFAEVAYYSMALAGWLVDHGMDASHVVVADAAIWPGSHEAAAIVHYAKGQAARGEQTTHEGLIEALEKDLETAPFEVFAFRLRGLMRNELVKALSTDWHDLEWHVDSRCSGCDYLGYPWVSHGNLTSDQAHCMPQAEREGQLSRIAFVTRGCRSSLESQGVGDVAALASLDGTEPVFETHQTLKAARALMPPRAAALISQAAVIPPRSGAGVMPKWADLKINITCEFDIGSGISLAFALSAFWLEHRDRTSTDTSEKKKKGWKTKVFVVPERSLNEERRHFLAFLQELQSILTDVDILWNQPGLQIYMWDRLTYRHLCKVVGRHLDAIVASPKGLAHLAWLFPSEEIVPNSRYSDNTAPITIVQDVVRAVLAAPVPHYYNLIRVARAYHDAGLPAAIAAFSIHPMFYDEFSDHIPSERAHEIWTRSAKRGFYWSDQIDRLKETVDKRLTALGTVVRRLQEDLEKVLVKKAAALPINAPIRNGSISVDGELWLAFNRLNSALDKLEAAQTRAMPAHEREARHKSARLIRRLIDHEEDEALEELDLQPVTGRRVYQMRPGSRQVKAKPGDFDFALSPELRPTFLEESLFAVAEKGGQVVAGRESRWRMADATKVSIVAIDRSRDLVVLDQGQGNWIDQLEAWAIVDLTHNVIMDPVHTDLFSRKLEASLRGLGNPPSAVTNPIVSRAVGSFLWPRPPKKTIHVPAADFIWDAVSTEGQRCSRDVAVARRALDESGARLNETQSMAFEEALSRRLHLVWGPPGTGKSRTLRAVIVGALSEALASGKRLRVLVTAFTWNAIENLLADVLGEIVEIMPDPGQVHRLHSSWRIPDVPATIAPYLTAVDPQGLRLSELRRRLDAPDGLVLCASTADQIRNVLKDAGKLRESLFDLVVIDEASQMDVAHAIVALASIAEGATLVLAGDPLQLAPIHKAEPPLKLEAVVGSVYSFFEKHHRIAQTMLAVNYRSNSTIVDFIRTAGYRDDLTAHSPDLRVRLLSAVPSERPCDWPDELWWTSEYRRILDPAKPVTCFVYSEGTSSQWNAFEADTVAALVKLLHGQLADGLENELDIDARPKLSPSQPYDDERFWTKGVGVVTPHRAQQGLIVSRLSTVFGKTRKAAERMRNAVDTVERFQGQQRDVMIASFALSDPDSIADEDDFLYNLNRFNVMASRARAKLIVLVSREIIDHLASDVETMHASRLIKTFVESFCSQKEDLSLGYLKDGRECVMSGSMRWRA